MHKILGAISLTLAALLSGCGSGDNTNNENQGNNTTSGASPVSSSNDVSPPTQGTPVYVTTKAFVESLQNPAPTPATDPEPAPTQEKLTLISDFNNDFAIRRLRDETQSSNNAFAITNRVQQLVMLTTDVNDAQKSQIMNLLAGNGNQGQADKLPTDFNIAKLLNSATTPQGGGYQSWFSSWGQYDFAFPETSLQALKTDFGSEVFAVDFVNDPAGSNLLIETWQSQISPYYTIDPMATNKTRLAFSSIDRLNSNWSGTPVTMTQSNFYGAVTSLKNFYDLRQNTHVTNKTDFLAGEFPLDEGNRLLLVMPHNSACISTPAIADNALAFDHPFLFFIINDKTGLIVYAGSYNKPNPGACDESSMTNFLSALNINKLNDIRSQLIATQGAIYVPQFNFGYLESMVSPVPNSNEPALYLDHFNSQITIGLDNHGITVSSSSAIAINLHALSPTSGTDIKGVHVGQDMSATVGQEFGYQNFDNVNNASDLISKFGLTTGAASGPSGWPTVFGSDTTDGTGF